MLINELFENAKYVQFPIENLTYREYSSLAGKEILRLPANDLLYRTWHLNWYHFTTQYHCQILYPIWASLFGFSFDPNDYHAFERYSDGNNISMVVPNKEYSFDVECFEKNEKRTDVSYERLISGKHGDTDYHKLFSYPHMCSKIVNNTINSDRKLFISGDSQMIPSIAFLASHFKEVYYFDNRTSRSFKGIIESNDYTDVLFALCNNDIQKYTKDNLR